MAHSLYDKFAGMVETGQLRYVCLEHCVTRQIEVAQERPAREIQLDARSSSLVVKEQAQLSEISISSDHDLYNAFLRRALAMDLVGLLTFGTHQKWIQRLFEILQQSPAPGFQKVTHAQDLRADRQSYIRMTDLSCGQLKPKADGSKPLDEILENMEQDMSVMYHLLQLPASLASENKPSKPAKRPSEPKQPKSASSAPPKPHNKARPAKRMRMPAGLEGCVAQTDDGTRLCFGYNLGTCPAGCDVKECPRGAHLCAKPGCFKQHPASAHR